MKIDLPQTSRETAKRLRENPRRLRGLTVQAIGPASADVTLWYFFIGFWILTKRFIYEPLIRKTLQNEKIREKLIFV